MRAFWDDIDRIARERLKSAGWQLGYLPRRGGQTLWIAARRFQRVTARSIPKLVELVARKRRPWAAP